MKNTIITSVSALVFLVIGLFIGKSNKQIEIQTVVKTNIIEKPAVEYVDKYITNAVENINKNLLTDDEKEKLYFGTLLGKAKRIEPNTLPKGVNSINLNVFISKNISQIISDKYVRNKIELDLKKIGVDVDENGEYLLTGHITAVPEDEGNSFVFQYSFNLNSIGYFFANEQCYRGLILNWEKDSAGIVGKGKAESCFNSIVEDVSTELCNIIVKSNQ